MMKKISLSILLAILSLGLICNAYAQSAQELWPAQLGNKWTYRIEGPINNGHEFDVEVTQRRGGWRYLEGDDEFYGTGWGDRWWWMSHNNGRIWAWDPVSFSFGRVFNLTVGEGNTFTSKIKDVTCLNEAVWMVADEDATTNTSVGTFNDCVIIENIDPPCADAGLTRMIFTPKVGLIEYSWTTIAGGHTAKLIHAIVDGIEYTQIVPTGGYSVSLNIDKITYTLTENRMPPIPPGGPHQHPDTLNVKLKIENQTDEKVKFEHNSSQEYDLIIRDDSGTEVYRWSLGRSFLMVETTRSLAPGKSVVFEEAIELRDVDDNPLQEGNYTIEGEHTTKNNALRQRAIAAFKIDLSVVY